MAWVVREVHYEDDSVRKGLKDVRKEPGRWIDIWTKSLLSRSGESIKSRRQSLSGEAGGKKLKTGENGSR